MSTRTITIEHNGTTCRGELGTITETMLGIESRGSLTAMLTIEGHPSWSVMAGGYRLEGKTGFGPAHIRAILATMKVDSWEKLRGKTVIAVFDDFTGSCIGIAHPTSGGPLIFAQHVVEHQRKHDDLNNA